jgi:hypothetical protein
VSLAAGAKHRVLLTGGGRNSVVERELFQKKL